MQNFTLFNSLPNGVIVFKNSQIYFLNEHIHNVLNLTYLSYTNSIEILYKTLNLEDESQLFDYFLSHDFFMKHTKVIQINHKREGEYDIFLFTLLFDSLVSSEITEEKEEASHTYIDEKVAKFFKLHKLKRVQVLTFYKGLPLKNFAKILAVSKDAILLQVDAKHTISLKEKKEITLIYNANKASSVILGEVVNHKGTRFTIKNFYLSKEGSHQRKEIRLKTNAALSILVGGREFEVYDISKSGISISLSDQKDEELLKMQTTATLLINNEMLEISLYYLKSIFRDKQLLKVVFEVQTSAQSKQRIEEYLTSKQNEILREIHQFLV